MPRLPLPPPRQKLKPPLKLPRPRPKQLRLLPPKLLLKTLLLKPELCSHG
jgi:hypothetical protein